MPSHSEQFHLVISAFKLVRGHQRQLLMQTFQLLAKINGKLLATYTIGISLTSFFEMEIFRQWMVIVEHSEGNALRNKVELLQFFQFEC